MRSKGYVHETENIVRQARNSEGRVTTELQNAPQTRREKREYQIDHLQQKSAPMQFYDVTFGSKRPKNDLTYDFFRFVR